MPRTKKNGTANGDVITSFSVYEAGATDASTADTSASDTSAADTSGASTSDILGDDDLSSAIDVASETLTGDVRDFILDRLKHEQDKRPWHERSESEQRDTVHRVEMAVHEVVRRAVELIAANGRRSIKATLEQITIKDGIKATLSMSKFDIERHKLFDSQGAKVLVVVADPDEFTGERAPVAVKPDQGVLPVEAVVVHSEIHETPFH